MSGLFFGRPTQAEDLRHEARDIEMGAPHGDGYAILLREFADTLDAAQTFSKSVCDMFEADAYWSVHDLPGAKTFFAAIGFTPPPAALLLDACADDEEQQLQNAVAALGS